MRLHVREVFKDIERIQTSTPDLLFRRHDTRHLDAALHGRIGLLVKRVSIPVVPKTIRRHRHCPRNRQLELVLRATAKKHAVSAASQGQFLWTN